ncbi:MAG: AAA family ATPase [Polyangia bacterium]
MHTCGRLGSYGQLAAADQRAFYLSVDTLGDRDLFETIDRLARTLGFDHFLLDEIHFLRDFEGALKKIFDFLDVRVTFTSSVSLALYAAEHDLARRIRLLTLSPFGFREYLRFARDRRIPSLGLEEIDAGRVGPAHLSSGAFFDEYLRGGVMPFSLEEPEVLPLLENVLKKIVANDIPAVTGIEVGELEALYRTAAFVGRSAVEGINPSSISRNVGITRYKAARYIELLERAFVLQTVQPAGSGVLREPEGVERSKKKRLGQ